MDNKNIDLKAVRYLDGKLFIGMVKAGMLNLKKHYKEVNDLNVFPVPDGDTGTNMRRTIETGFDVIKNEIDAPLYKVAQDLSKGMLLGARGNSGVILSQIFRGFSNGLDQKTMVWTPGLHRAFRYAVKQAYGSVVKPVEGTILTVIKESVNIAGKQISPTIYSYITALCAQAEITLAKTKEILPVLEEADVVDSGGAGLVYILNGFKAFLEGNEMPQDDSKIAKSSNVEAGHVQPNVSTTIDFSAFNENSVLDYGYCTEFILQLQNLKVNLETFDEKEVVDYLKTQGDSIVCFRDGSVIKTHVHTKDPGAVLSYVKRWGEFLTVKVENMSLQHNQVVHEKNSKNEEKQIVKNAPHKSSAIVAVCQGAGIKQTYLDLGVDYIVDGKQTMNPSTQDFIKAFNSIDADTIYVLPNNSNIILTAEQASKLYLEVKPETRILVIKTKNVAQGYLAASMLSIGAEDEKSVLEDIRIALASTESIEVTHAVRDTKISGINVKKGDFISIKDGELVYDNPSKVDCLLGALEKINGIEDKELLFIIYGKENKKDENQITKDSIISKYPNIEIQEINGGQDIYNYIVSVS